MKKVLCVLFSLALVFMSCMPLFSANAQQVDPESLRGTKLYVYNWGEYISDGQDGSLDVNAEFEEKYGIEVVYNTYDNNESMYAKLQSGGVSYDVVIPSDYMIERMINEDMLEKLDFDNIPNYRYIEEKYKNLDYDPANEYSVPFNVGMVGLIYNNTLVEEAPTSWNALWDERYSGQILMFNNPRDAFAIAQSLLGLDYNSEASDDWQAAAEKLKVQKGVLQSYVNDEVFNKMESGEAALAPYYAGDYLSMVEINPDLGFVYPSEGVNFFVDAMCVLKGSQNKAAAELYINFMLEADIALANAEYLCYASPNTQVINNEDYAFYGNEILYPSAEQTVPTQIFTNLSDETLGLMNSLWDDVKNHQTSDGDDSTSSSSAGKYYILLGAFVLVCVVVIVFSVIRKKRREAD